MAAPDMTPPSSTGTNAESTLDGERFSKKPVFGQFNLILTPPKTPTTEQESTSTPSTPATLLTSYTLDRRLRPPVNFSPVSYTGTPDRFIRPPSAIASSRTVLLTAKPTSELTRAQRAERRRSNLSDPFITEAQIAERRQPSNETQARAARQAQLRLEYLSSFSHNVKSERGIWDIHRPSLYGPMAPQRTRCPYQAAQARADSTAPTHVSRFLREGENREKAEASLYEERLALALDIDMSSRVVAQIPSTRPRPSLQVSTGNAVPGRAPPPGPIEWKDGHWMQDGRIHRAKVASKATKAVPLLPFRVLEAPQLRDDFYSTVLAYSRTAGILAVALGDKLYFWSETKGVNAFDDEPRARPYITCLAFSSESGRRAILARSRADGNVKLTSPLDSDPLDPSRPGREMEILDRGSVFAVSFRPKPLRRTSLRSGSRQPAGTQVDVEVLLVGNVHGVVSIHFVEWPTARERDLFDWGGCVVQYGRIDLHEQQICGIGWSLDGTTFATGSNDNACNLVEFDRLLKKEGRPRLQNLDLPHDSPVSAAMMGSSPLVFSAAHARHSWRLNAAIKAIAFCPWQPGLLAIGGGSNDRRIHFYHSVSGTCLARIDCAAQVTSLIWSTTRREICATFGFAQPEHPYRIAVYAWPSCEQVHTIPFRAGDMRALHAVAYPGGPREPREAGNDSGCSIRTRLEGSIVVASNDRTIKFHEVWAGRAKLLTPHRGHLGGSAILEELHGIAPEGLGVIR